MSSFSTGIEDGIKRFFRSAANKVAYYAQSVTSAFNVVRKKEKEEAEFYLDHSLDG